MINLIITKTKRKINKGKTYITFRSKPEALQKLREHACVVTHDVPEQSN